MGFGKSCKPQTLGSFGSSFGKLCRALVAMSNCSHESTNKSQPDKVNNRATLMKCSRNKDDASCHQFTFDLTTRNWRENITPFLLFGIAVALLCYFFKQQRVPFEDPSRPFWHRVGFFTCVIVLKMLAVLYVLERETEIIEFERASDLLKVHKSNFFRNKILVHSVHDISNIELETLKNYPLWSRVVLVHNDGIRLPLSEGYRRDQKKQEELVEQLRKLLHIHCAATNSKRGDADGEFRHDKTK